MSNKELLDIIEKNVQDSPSTKSKYLDSKKQARIKDILSDIELKKLYAYLFIGILIGQLLIMNCVFILVGCHVLSFTDYVLHLYLGGTLAEIFGVVLVITKYLFSRK